VLNFLSTFTTEPARMPALSGYRVSIWMTEARVSELWNRPHAAGRLVCPLRTGLLAGSEELAQAQQWAAELARALNGKRLGCWLAGLGLQCELAFLRAALKAAGEKKLAKLLKTAFGDETIKLTISMDNTQVERDVQSFAGRPGFGASLN
jgi:hypothetical protein